MKALIKTAPGHGNVGLENVPEPKCERDAVRIEMKFAGICGTDLHIYHDTFNNEPPVILGHEFSGIVTEIGNDIKEVKVGDRVAVLGSNAETCGTCSYCKTGYYIFCPERKGMGIHVDGSFTKYVTCREDMVYKIPDKVSLKEAALFEPLACGVQAIEELTDIKVGDTVLISGPGPIGLICLSLLALKGCKIIVAGTTADSIRLELAKELGADVLVNVFEQDLQSVIMAETNGQGVDVTVDCSGNSISINNCLKVVKKKGKHIQVGIVGTQSMLDVDQILYKQVQFYGSLAHSIQTWNRVSQIIEQQKINLTPIITHVLPLDKWEEAFQLCEEKKCGKVF